MLKKIIEVIKLIKQKGYVAYLVGGSSRDLLLCNDLIDIDIATNMPLKLISQLFQVIDEKGKSLGSIKISYKGINIDLTLFRKEIYDDKSIYPHISFVSSVEEDYLRRDFTINAIYIDVSNNNLIDPSDGLNDLLNSTIRFIGNPNIRIQEDPTRIIRAIRFASRFNFIIEEKSKKAILDNIDLIKRIPANKLEKELSKLKDKKVLKEYNLEGLL